MGTAERGLRAWTIAGHPRRISAKRRQTLAVLPFRQITLISGSPVHDLKIELIPQSVAWGKVTDRQGDPVMGVQVTALASRVVDGRARFQQAASGMTNDLGEYRVANLQRGKYILCVHQNQPGIQSASRTTTADTCYPGPVEGGAASAIDLPAGRERKSISP